ncbi:hypothetical protein V6N13_130603 [Hibiscus sabdariffa]|uniref:Glabrous enhancer-binding protein-like DBD domain-containing protein n=2 Tax=Hibiscus sabdariffa TaxID=183260 RepID=A0ABR2P074_9ROSI
MARKRPTQDPLPPASSSSSSEEEDDSAKVGSHSEYDSDKSLPSPNVSAFTIKSIVPKSDPKPNESSSKRKRPSSSTSNGGAGAVKLPVTVRRWSETEEITILKGLIEYRAKEGADSFKDPGSGFYDFIKKRFKTDVSKTQLSEKTRRLKNKYKANAEKGQNGNDPHLPNSHDRKCFQLSKKIWGNETNERSKRRKNLRCPDEDKSIEKEGKNEKKTKALSLSSEDGGKAEVNGGEIPGSGLASSSSESDDEDFWEEYPCLKEFFEIGFMNSVGFCLLENGEVIGREKLKEMEREARQLKIERLELYLKSSKLAQDFAKAALASIKGTEI